MKAVPLVDHDEMHLMSHNLIGQHFGNVYMEYYATELTNHLRESDEITKFLKNVELKTDWKPHKSRFEKQLYQVARFIAARNIRRAERDIFYVSQPGRDHHSRIEELLANNLGEFDHPLQNFVKELQAQGVYDDAVIPTMSDFGRKLTFNGRGTDHGWASNHYLFGGAVRGGMHNNFLKSFELERGCQLGRSGYSQACQSAAQISRGAPHVPCFGAPSVTGLFRKRCLQVCHRKKTNKEKSGVGSASCFRCHVCGTP